MAGGGRFDSLTGKVRPGTYINFESQNRDSISVNARGTVLIPLIDHDYGPAKEFITIPSSQPDSAQAKLGYSVYDQHPSCLLIREALKNASAVMVYIPRQGAKASATVDGLTATALYGGARGNDLRFSITENPTTGYDVTVYLADEEVELFEELETAEALIAAGSEWIAFTGEGDLSPVAGVNLTGGATDSSANSDITTFLDDAETQAWDVLAFPLEETTSNAALFETVRTKIKYLREDVGKYRVAVLPNFEADYDGVINVTNSVKLTDGTELSVAQVTAWVAGADAGASNTTSNTQKKYVGAVEIIEPKNHTAAVAAIKNGEFFFSYSEAGDVVVEADINSLVTLESHQDKTYQKNRVRRVFDTFADAVKLNFPPNKYDNSNDGWDLLEGDGGALLKLFADAGAITNVDYDNDFLVDRAKSTGDEVYITVALQPVDSAEKLYFTVETN